MKTNPPPEDNYYHYNPRLKNFARDLRKHPTKAEKMLWQMLRKQQLLGYTFNRQRPTLDYVVDFICKTLMLIIEADGITHEMDGRKEKDAIRDNEFREKGFTILRYEDWEIISKPEEVYAEIKAWIENKHRELFGTTDIPPE